MKKILMCPPAYYNIKYEINPWMNLNKPATPSLAKKQWENLYNTLKNDLKLDIELIDPDPELPDMVFAANAGLVKENKFICSNFRFKERQPEKTLFAKWFKKKSYNVISLPNSIRFEGEGDALFLGDSLFAGYKFRSDIQSHKHIAKLLDTHVISIELSNPYFYHLDTCFCPVNKEMIFYYPYAFDLYSRRILKNSAKNKTRVLKKEARDFCCNAIVYKNKIVMNKGAEKLKEQLEKQGFIIYEVDLGEFIKAGGSAKCLVAWI